jgi:hypothetical protein
MVDNPTLPVLPFTCSLLISRGGVRTKLDRLGGELLSQLVDLAKEAVLAGSIGLGVPLFLMAAAVSAGRSGLYGQDRSLGDQVVAWIDVQGDQRVDELLAGTDFELV